MTDNANNTPGKPVFYDDPWQFYNAMLTDIESAEKNILIESYKFGNDNIGERFRDVLARKAREGVSVKLLIDSWGAQVSQSFFRELKDNGGEVRFFMKIKFFWDFFTKNHRRNHRKIILIDDHITYLGSANISGHSLNWCESVLRIDDVNLNNKLTMVFWEDFELYNRYVFKKPGLTRLIRTGEFEILRDIPSITRQVIKKRYEKMIKNARQRVIIETPYFLPGFLLRKALSDAAKRGVDITVITPRSSDVHVVDVVRSRYIGMLYKNGINFRFYQPGNLHAKLMVIDNETFALGSPNFDYRSFRYQHEILLIGQDPGIISQIKDHISNCLAVSANFDYEEWLKRSFMQRFTEWLFLPFRHLL